MNNTREIGVTIFPQEATSSPAALDAWIARATHGLCAQAKERVQREIISHHFEAFDDLCSAGALPNAAYEQALEGLGDAVTANKALRKTYLTTWQQRLLASLAQPVKPLTEEGYEILVLMVSYMQLLAFSRFWRDYFSSPIVRWSGLILGFSLTLVYMYLLYRSGYAPFNRLHRTNDTQALPRKPTAMKRLYPWFLMACSLCLYAIWNIQNTKYMRGGDLLYFWIPACVAYGLSFRIHKHIGAHCFDQSKRLTWGRSGWTILYIIFLALAGVLWVCWPPSWTLITDLARPSVGVTPLLTNIHSINDRLVDLVVLGVSGIVTAVALLATTVRWIIGLYLLQKQRTGNGTTEAGPEPSPETPLDE